jgi:hypothetical protein
MRVSSDKAQQFLPALKRAANAIAAIDADAMPVSKTGHDGRPPDPRRGLALSSLTVLEG